MKNTIIIHGSPDKEEFYSREYPSPSNFHWFPWLQRELNFRNEISLTPEMPAPYDPIYSNYLDVIKGFEINRDTNLIGHSSGGGFWLRYLSENKSITPDKLILVAPWIDPERELSTPFFGFEIDVELTNRTEVHIFMSSDDKGCSTSFEIIEQKLPNAIYHKYTDRRHFCTKEFPELLEIIK